MLVHIFGAASSPTCPNLALQRTAKNNRFYVDDCLKSVEGVQAAIRVVDQFRQMLAEGGFHLAKWIFL